MSRNEVEHTELGGRSGYPNQFTSCTLDLFRIFGRLSPLEHASLRVFPRVGETLFSAGSVHQLFPLFPLIVPRGSQRKKTHR